MVGAADFKDRHRRSAKDFTRDRVLTFERVFFLQVSILRASISRELRRFFRALSETGLNAVAATDGAFCKARLKMSPAAFAEVSRSVIERFYEGGHAKLQDGLRLLSFDGSTLRIKGSKSTREYFGEISNGNRRYCLGRALMLYDVLNGLIVDAVLAPLAIGERDLARRCFSPLGPGDLVLMDIGFPGVAFFRELLATGAAFCVRLSTSQWQRTVAPFLASEKPEQIVSLPVTREALQECREKGLDTSPLRVRLVRVDLPDGTVEVLVTSLTDCAAYPVEQFAALYMRRWRIEEGYKASKCRIEMENFTGKSVCTVLQDFHSRVLSQNLTSILSIPAAEQCREKTRNRKLQYQLNFTDALAELHHWGPRLFCTDWGRDLLQMIWQSLSTCLSAVRPGRHVPRNKTPSDKKCAGYAFAYKPLA